MLRRLVFWLLLANLAYWAWGQGWLVALGPWAAPAVQREPERLQQQIDPGGITLLPPSAAPTATSLAAAPPVPAPADGVAGATGAADATPVPPEPAPPAAEPVAAPVATPPVAASAPANEPRMCLQMGVLTERQAEAIRPVLDRALPKEAWSLESSVQPARWVVYIGRLPNADTLVSRRAELRQLRVDYRDVTVPGLPPGLALGTYSSEGAAQQSLRDLTRAGVKGARVAEERTEATLYMARLPKVTAAQRTAATRALAAVAGSPWGNKSLQPCP
jgi:hypothetical protein